LRLRRHRPHLSGEIQRIAHPRRLRQRQQAFDELIVNRPMDQGSRSRDACLSGRGEDAGHHALHRVVDIRIVENDVRGLPAEFQRDLLDPLRCQAVYVFAGAVAAGKRDLRHVGMRDERLANLMPESG